MTTLKLASIGAALALAAPAAHADLPACTYTNKVTPLTAANPTPLVQLNGEQFQLYEPKDKNGHAAFFAAPTASKTLSRYGALGADLAFPVVAGKSVFYLFGDTRPIAAQDCIKPAKPLGFWSSLAGVDSIGVHKDMDLSKCNYISQVDQAMAAGSSPASVSMAGCPAMSMLIRLDSAMCIPGGPLFQPTTITDGKASNTYGYDETPTGGFEHDGYLYMFYQIDTHDYPTTCGSSPAKLQFHSILVRSAVKADQLATSQGATFKKVYDFSQLTPFTKTQYLQNGCYAPPADNKLTPAAGKFTRTSPVLVAPGAVDTKLMPAPFQQATQILFAFGGTWRHPHSNLYLAALPITPTMTWKGTSDWYYLTGIDQTTLVPQWTKGADTTGPATNPAEIAAVPVVPIPGSKSQQCTGANNSFNSSCVDSADITQESVAYYPSLGRFVLMYTGGTGAVFLRSSTQPWGPWSCPQRVLDRQSPWSAKLVHQVDSSKNPLDPITRDVYSKPTYQTAPDLATLMSQLKSDPPVKIAGDTNYVNIGEGTYYMPALFADKVTPNGNGVDVYFTLSLWNPYAALLMKATLACGDGSAAPCK